MRTPLAIPNAPNASARERQQAFLVAARGSNTSEQVRSLLPADRGIQFLTGSLEQAITVIASARVLFAMDSGNVHFANFLDVPAVGLFGKSDPKSIVGCWGSVLPIYERKFACQPCGRATCNQPEVYCMNSIAPETVARALIGLLEANDRKGMLGERKVRLS